MSQAKHIIHNDTDVRSVSEEYILNVKRFKSKWMIIIKDLMQTIYFIIFKCVNYLSDSKMQFFSLNSRMIIII